MEKTLAKNLERKKPLINNVKLTSKGPLLSFIDLNTGEFCNRKCVFCPRVNPDNYPNQRLWMKPSLAQKLSNDLKDIGFEGIVNVCGYGEPLANPDIVEIIKLLSINVHTELVTNGDLLNEKVIQDLYKANLSQLVVSAYDGPHQITKFQKLVKDSGIPGSFLTVRNRWYGADEGFGIKMTNRGGVIETEKSTSHEKRPCAYTHYSLTIDFNGDVLLCVQDWNKKLKFGNVYAESVEDIWFSKRFNQYRKKLSKERLKAGHPCSICDADGMVLGKNHLKAWEEFYKN
tara:strand:+ start:1817 stop:2677 length:861 start_codon:yes stop_codon:yes gene_type:complete